jgi:hypothetical protein
MDPEQLGDEDRSNCLSRLLAKVAAQRQAGE